MKAYLSRRNQVILIDSEIERADTAVLGKPRNFILQVSDFCSAGILGKQEAFKVCKRILNFDSRKLEGARLKHDAFPDGHWYFAERGFAGVRVDARGTGGSEGINTDEYAPREQEDGWDAVEWIARQRWRNGNVGMFGTSYAGFTALQVAMHRPPHVNAIVPLYATDDRYTDGCHYTQGGSMRMYCDLGCYGGMMVAINALPPHPKLSGPQREEMWKLRLEQNEPYILKWMEQQVDGPYWRHASLRPQYDRVECPTFLIRGWRDGYASPRLRHMRSIVNKNVDCGKTFNRRLGHVPDALYAGDIGVAKNGLASQLTDEFCRFLSTRVVNVRHGNLCPLFGEQQSDGPASAQLSFSVSRSPSSRIAKACATSKRALVPSNPRSITWDSFPQASGPRIAPESLRLD